MSSTQIGADVRVVGVGGAGGNAVRHLIGEGIEGATLCALNTDGQALVDHPADRHLVLGQRTTRGLGAGGRPSVGFAAAQESSRDIAGLFEGADLVFVAAGLGGGTGTGASPLIAHLAREAGALVVGVVTVPFGFEGGRRCRLAEAGLDALEEQVDSLLVIENDRLLDLGLSDPSALEAFALADRILGDGVRGIGDLVTQSGLINLDFADLRAVLTDGGRALLGIGEGRGPDRASQAIENALRCPLLADRSLEGASGVLMSFTVDGALGLGKIHRAAARVQALVDDDAEILFGVAVDPSLEDEVKVTLCAAGVGREADEARPDQEVAAAVSPRSTGSRAAPSRKSDPDVVLARPHTPAYARRRNGLVMLDR
ncbi:MAG: cell division protein FtsZ [Sandaracinaceae bacterium]